MQGQSILILYRHSHLHPELEFAYYNSDQDVTSCRRESNQDHPPKLPGHHQVRN